MAMTQILLGADTHQRRCHYAYAYACADGGAYGASNESASNPASDKADYGFRRNRATHEREGQSYLPRPNCSRLLATLLRPDSGHCPHPVL